MNDLPALGSGPMAEELALLGHDIRSAVVDIMAGLALIDDSAMSPTDRQQMDRTRAASEILVRLLEEGLATLLSQAPARVPQAAFGPSPLDSSLQDHTPLGQTAFDLPQLMSDIARRWAYAADGSRVVMFRTGASLPSTITGSRTDVERILSNLISNALHHANGQPVEVDVFTDGPQELCFCIRDHGPGFPETLTQALFPPVLAGSALPLWQTADGHGLGLRIAQSLSHRMGGRVTLQNSHSGRGGVARLFLPLHPAPSLPKATGHLQGQKILLADDSATQLLLIGQFLIECGAEVTLVRDGLSAASALRDGRFDLALLDMEMPGRSGLEVAQDLQTLGITTRLVFLTAHTAASVRSKSEAAGADLVVTKPVTSAAALSAALSGLTRPKPLAAALVHLLDIAGPETAAELIARFQLDLADVQTRITTGLPLHDWAALRGASHVLIALAGTAGAQRLEAEARQFNCAATDNDSARIDALATSVLQGLADLIAFVDQTAQSRKVPA